MGTMTFFDHARGRYLVELDSDGETREHKLKPENLAQYTGRRGVKQKQTKMKKGAT